MWLKKGLIFNVEGKNDWGKSHAQVPVVDVLDDRLRVYYSTRNSLGQSNVSFIEISKDNPSQILYEHPEVLFDLGRIGTFDDSGLMPTCILTVGELKYLYYIGWSVRTNVPYQNAIGLAISRDSGKTFEKLSEGPIISVNQYEPYFSGTAYVIRDEKLFKMWYLSCIGWEKLNDKIEPKYNINYAESDNGIDWKQTGKIAIELQEEEGGLVSASVIKTAKGYRMWFGKRKQVDFRTDIKNTYRIGYAESKDGILWKRLETINGLDISDSGWDSEMVSYPYVVEVENKLIMFYNGNGFGLSGFGYAFGEL